MAQCIVSYVDLDSVRHSVEVEASGLYEAAILGLCAFRKHEIEPGGWRTPTLNAVCLEVLTGLYKTAGAIGATDPDHYVFPWQGGKSPNPQKLAAKKDPAWRSILKEAGIQARFHDLRHTAVTQLAKAGLPDHVIMAQVGHVDPSMMKHYSHIRGRL